MKRSHCHAPNRAHPIRQASVERTSPSEIALRWETAPPGLPISIHAGATPESIDYTRLLHRTSAGSQAIRPANRQARQFFALTADEHPDLVVTERLLPLQGTRNCRDLGGYPTTDGRGVRWGKVYRSDDLAELTEEDHRYLLRQNVRLICDLRGSDETAQEPDRLPGHGVEYLHLPTSHETFAPRSLKERIRSGGVEGLDENYMIEAYRRMLLQFGPTFGTIFRRIASPGGTPLIFHCAGEKDRTGIAAALLLLALGVPEEFVLQDYALTNVYAAERIERFGSMLESRLPDATALRVILTAAPIFMESTIRRIHADFGSVEGYLTSNAGVGSRDLEKVRAHLLDPV